MEETEYDVPEFEEIESILANPSIENFVIPAHNKDRKYNSIHFFSIFSETTSLRFNKYMEENESDEDGDEEEDEEDDDGEEEEDEGGDDGDGAASAAYGNISGENSIPAMKTVLGGPPPKPDDWDQIDQGVKSNPLTLMRLHILFHSNAITKVRIGEIQFNCHFVVLQCYSSFFWRMDPHTKYVELNEQEITPQGFMMTYDWMLSDCPIIRRSGLSELLQSAYYLGIPALEDQCWRCLDNDKCVREYEAFRLYLDGFQCYDFKTFRDLFLSRVCKYFLALVADDAFVKLNLNEVCTLLSSCSIGVNTEGEVLMAALRWIHHDFKDRSCFNDVLMSCVRFKLMTSAYLSYLVLDDFCPITAAALASRPTYMELVRATTFTTNMELAEFKTPKFIKFISSFKVVPPRERQWIIDRNCPYHHRLLCASNSELDYNTFTDYMAVLKKRPANYWTTFEFATLEEGGMCFNASCIEEQNTRIHTALIANRQLSVAYLRHLTGDPIIKFTASAEEVLKSVHVQKCCRLAKKKSLRMIDTPLKVIESVESLELMRAQEPEPPEEFADLEELDEIATAKQSAELPAWSYPKRAITNNRIRYTVRPTDVENKLHLVPLDDDDLSKTKHKSKHSHSNRHGDGEDSENEHILQLSKVRTAAERAQDKEISVQTDFPGDGDYVENTIKAEDKKPDIVKCKVQVPSNEMSVQTDLPVQEDNVEPNAEAVAKPQEKPLTEDELLAMIKGAVKKHNKNRSHKSKHTKNIYKNVKVPAEELIQCIAPKGYVHKSKAQAATLPTINAVTQDDEYALPLPVDKQTTESAPAQSATQATKPGEKRSGVLPRKSK